MLAKVIGIKKAPTKSGKTAFNYYLAVGFNDYDRENCDVDGNLCRAEFSYKDFGIRVGDVVDVQYEPGFEGKATLSDIIPVNIPFEKSAPAVGEKESAPAVGEKKTTK